MTIINPAICIISLFLQTLSSYLWTFPPLFWFIPFIILKSKHFMFQDSVRQLLSSYLHRFSTLAGPVITCGPVLNWLELDNRGHRLIVTDDCAINTPAVAAAYAIKRYAKQASDEISFEVGVLLFYYYFLWLYLVYFEIVLLHALCIAPCIRLWLI